MPGEPPEDRLRDFSGEPHLDRDALGRPDERGSEERCEKPPTPSLRERPAPWKVVPEEEIEILLGASRGELWRQSSEMGVAEEQLVGPLTADEGPDGGEGDRAHQSDEEPTSGSRDPVQSGGDLSMQRLERAVVELPSGPGEAEERGGGPGCAEVRRTGDPDGEQRGPGRPPKLPSEQARVEPSGEEDDPWTGFLERRAQSELERVVKLGPIVGRRPRAIWHPAGEPKPRSG